MALVSIGSIDDFPEGRPTFAEADGERLMQSRQAAGLAVRRRHRPYPRGAAQPGDGGGGQIGHIGHEGTVDTENAPTPLRPIPGCHQAASRGRDAFRQL